MIELARLAAALLTVGIVAWLAWFVRTVMIDIRSEIRADFELRRRMDRRPEPPEPDEGPENEPSRSAPIRLERRHLRSINGGRVAAGILLMVAATTLVTPPTIEAYRVIQGWADDDDRSPHVAEPPAPVIGGQDDSVSEPDPTVRPTSTPAVEPTPTVTAAPPVEQEQVVEQDTPSPTSTTSEPPTEPPSDTAESPEPVEQPAPATPPPPTVEPTPEPEPPDEPTDPSLCDDTLDLPDLTCTLLPIDGLSFLLVSYGIHS